MFSITLGPYRGTCLTHTAGISSETPTGYLIHSSLSLGHVDLPKFLGKG